jgi:hypothetical protein
MWNIVLIIQIPRRAVATIPLVPTPSIVPARAIRNGSCPVVAGMVPMLVLVAHSARGNDILKWIRKNGAMETAAGARMVFLEMGSGTKQNHHWRKSALEWDLNVEITAWELQPPTSY